LEYVEDVAEQALLIMEERWWHWIITNNMNKGPANSLAAIQ
jgi:hypothetical protein